MSRLTTGSTLLLSLMLGCDSAPTKQSTTSPTAGQSSPIPAELEAQWPKTVEEAVNQVISKLTAEDRKLIRETPKDDLIHFHHGFGTHLRNSLGLWQGNTALLKDCGADHPDDASAVLIERIWEQLRQTGPDSPE